MNTFAPGWYPDPHDPHAQRYWDGEGWTPHTHPTGQAGRIPDPPGRTAVQDARVGGPPARKESLAWLWWTIGISATLLVVAAIAAVWWASSIIGQTSAEEPSPCDRSLERCAEPERESPEPEPAPVPAPEPREQEATAELRGFCEAGAVEAYLDLQSAAIAALNGGGTIDDVRAQLDVLEQELAQMPEEAASSAGYAATEAELRQFLIDVRAATDAGDTRGVAALILDAPDVVGAFAETCSGHGFIGW